MCIGLSIRDYLLDMLPKIAKIVNRFFRAKSQKWYFASVAAAIDINIGKMILHFDIFVKLNFSTAANAILLHR